MYIYVLPQHYLLAFLGLDFTGRMVETNAMTRLVHGIYTYMYIYIYIYMYIDTYI